MKTEKRFNYLAIFPLVLFVLAFTVFPMIYVMVISFLTRGDVFGIKFEFTIQNFVRIFDPLYLNVFLTSIILALETTALCFLVGYPFGYFLSKRTKRWRSIIMFLVIVPFWTSSLIRIYGWVILLRADGMINSILLSLGIVDEPLKMLYTNGAVLVGMIYAMLPFMILPVYTSAEKLDWSMVEAARDLGAGKFTAFVTITLKATLPGIMSGCILVFIPSMGLFFISDLLGGSKTMLAGNLIKNELMNARDWPFGSALSIIMMVLMFLFIYLYRKLTGQKDLEGF